jgi:hypothetical protein
MLANPADSRTSGIRVETGLAPSQRAEQLWFRAAEFVGTARTGKPRLYGNSDFPSLFRDVRAGFEVVKIIEAQAE